MSRYKKIRVNGRRVNTHIFKAMKAIGGPLPAGVEVHHFDFNRKNNENSNLVICENRKYHRLLHSRKRVLDAGGSPELHKICFACKALKLKSEFVKAAAKFDGLRADCRPCMKARKDIYRQRLEVSHDPI